MINHLEYLTIALEAALNALVAALAFGVAAQYVVIAFAVVPRLTAATQAAPGLMAAARWGATAFFAGCAVTHTWIGFAAVGDLSGTSHGTGSGPLGTLLAHVVPHVAQLVGGLTFIIIAGRRLEWTLVAKDVAADLRARERQFRVTFERAPSGILLISTDEQSVGEILDLNPAMQELAGDRTLLGRRYADLFRPKPVITAEALAAWKLRPEVTRSRRQLVRADDSLLWVDVEAALVPGAGGPETGGEFCLVQVRDITDRRRTEALRSAQHGVAEALADAGTVAEGLREALRAICEALTWAGGEFWEEDRERSAVVRRAGWWSPDFAGSNLAVAPGSRDLAGAHAGGDPDLGRREIWVVDTAHFAERNPRAAEASACGLHAVIGLPTRSGERSAVLVLFAAAAPTLDREVSTALEAISAHVGRFVERGRAEEFRTLLEASPDAVVITSGNGRIVLVNARTEALFGFRREEVLGRPVQVLLTGDPVAGRHRDGTRFPVEVSVQQVQRDGEQLTSHAVRDLSARHQAEQLRFRLAAIVDSSRDAIVGTTLEGRITSWNRAAQEIFGYAEDEVVDQPMTVLLPTEERLEQDLLARLRRGEPTAPRDALGRRRDGSTVPVSISSSPVRDPQGGVVGAAKVIRDITDRTRAEAALAEAKEAAEAANRALEAFSYSVAHDLKAPLRTIGGFSRILLEQHADGLDDDGQRFLTMVSTSATQLGALIDGLHELSRLASRDLQRREVDLGDLAARAVHRLRQGEPDRQVRVDIHPDLLAQGDATLLASVLDNLLGNAWKFTRDHPDARIEVGSEDGAFFVRDNGVGFDMAHAGKLFGVFQRLHRQDEFEGTGVGLATVQRIVHRHGGDIRAQASSGGGATFWFTLAAARPASQDRAAATGQRAAVPST